MNFHILCSHLYSVKYLSTHWRISIGYVLFQISTVLEDMSYWRLNQNMFWAVWLYQLIDGSRDESHVSHPSKHAAKPNHNLPKHLALDS